MNHSASNTATRSFRAAHGNPPQTVPVKAKPFSIRFSPEEKAELVRKADGLPLGVYIKARLFDGRRSRKSVRKTDRETAAQILAKLGQSKLAHSMNEMAEAAKIGALPVMPETEEDIRKACYDIACMRMMLMKALGKHS